jgi:hypothetical protein
VKSPRFHQPFSLSEIACFRQLRILHCSLAHSNLTSLRIGASVSLEVIPIL